MLLFVCMSLYQLISFINVKVNLYPDTPADLILTKTTDFSSCAQAVRETGLFENVIDGEWGEQGTRGHFGADIEENTAIMKRAGEHRFAIKTGKSYTDIFCYGVIHSYIYLLYYQMVGQGIIPAIHLVEDGSSSYMQDLLWCKATGHDDGMIDHTVFPEEKRIFNNIKESLLYEPEMFSGRQCLTEHNRLPKDSESLERLKPYLYQVFGKPELPPERYIFFNEPFAFAEGKNSNETDILDRIAEIVGKENIIVKVHPRSDSSQFAVHGYKTMAETAVPWEIFSSLSDIDSKVLLAISSNCLFTPNMLFNRRINSIYLYKVMVLSKRYHMCLPDVNQYFNNMYKFINKDEKQLYIPKSMNELECDIRYLEGLL